MSNSCNGGTSSLGIEEKGWRLCSTPLLNPVGEQNAILYLQISVVEPFHFGPALASQDSGSGSGSGSSSSSSPVDHNLLLKFFFFITFHFSIYWLVVFTELYECFALLFQYFTKRDRLI